jgi:IclR family pca regulon transcriptional regulator
MGRVLLAGLSLRQRNQYLLRVKLKRLTTKTIVNRASLHAILNEVASNGYALVDGELEPGLRSIAVPVRGADDKVVAAMNVGAHVASVTIEDMKHRILPILFEYAQMLSGLLQMNSSVSHADHF